MADKTIQVGKGEDETEKPLPLFRPELKLFRGPEEPDGSPTFNLFDPVQSKYFKISWKQSLIFEFMRPGMNAKELADEVNKNTTTTFNPEDIMMFFKGMGQYNLLRVPKSSDKLIEEVQKGKMNPIKWLLLHYLYVRIPLINPDAFLTKTLKYAELFVSKTAIALYILLGGLGIIMLIPQFGEYLATFPYFFNFEGILVFGLGIIFVKVIHELSHAYTAKHYGIYVPTMGIVLLVLYPAMYTDVTHGWQLKSRKKRFAISVAGVVSELVLAAISTLGWCLTSPGLLNSTFFILSSSSWLTSLLVNVNPAMRFDGYYLLSDLWGVDNLQNRAFAITRWKFRKFFLGMDLPPPETELSEKRIRGMVIYTIYTWTYRLFLYTAIALFVYFKFTKALGVFLFLVEILVFFIWPVVSEVAELYDLRKYFTKNPRILTTATLLSLVFLWFAVPLPHTLKFPGIVEPSDRQLLYSPEGGVIDEVMVKRFDVVQKGKPLIEIRSLPLEVSAKNQLIESRILKEQIETMEYNEKLRNQISYKKGELAASVEKLKSLTQEEKKLHIKAEYDGTVYELDELLKPGVYIGKNQVLGKVADPNLFRIAFYVPERNLEDISVGMPFTFTVPTPYVSYEGTVTRIQKSRVQVLQHPSLSSVYHSDLPAVKGQGGAHILLESYYLVEGELDPEHDHSIRFGKTGKVTVTGPWRSKLMELFRAIQRVLYRESGA